MNKEELVKVYDTLLAVPGMSDQVKLDFRMSRKQVLILSYVIHQGLTQKEGPIPLLLSVLPKETAHEIRTIGEECLQKSGLTDLNAKLKLFADLEHN